MSEEVKSDKQDNGKLGLLLIGIIIGALIGFYAASKLFENHVPVYENETELWANFNNKVYLLVEQELKPGARNP